MLSLFTGKVHHLQPSSVRSLSTGEVQYLLRSLKITQRRCWVPGYCDRCGRLVASHLPALHNSGTAMCRVAMHLVTSDEPLKRVDMKAALATKDSQGRRRLLSSVTGTCIHLL